ncbi:MAG: hypothetical protein ABH881_00630 [bacterium]
MNFEMPQSNSNLEKSKSTPPPIPVAEKVKSTPPPIPESAKKKDSYEDLSPKERFDVEALKKMKNMDTDVRPGIIEAAPEKGGMKLDITVEKEGEDDPKRMRYWFKKLFN